MRFASFAFSLGLVMCACAKLSAAPVIIDGFTKGSLNYSATGSNNVNGANESAVDTLGGNRASSVDHLFDAGTSTVTLSTGGPMTISGSNQIASLGYGLVYSGGGMDAQASTDLNANLSGTNALTINLPSISSTVLIQVTLTTDVNNTAFYRGISNNGSPILVGSAGTVTIPYSSLPAFNGGVDLSDVDYILVTLQTSNQMTVGGVTMTTTPEPVVGIGVVMLILARHRRRRMREI
jgi:hypothetical protein